MSQHDLMDEWHLVTQAGWDALKGLGQFGRHFQELDLLGTLSADCCGRRALASLGVDTAALAEAVLAAIKTDARDLPTDGQGAMNRALQRASEAA